MKYLYAVMETISITEKKKLSFTKIEDVAKRAEQVARKGTAFIFHWRGGYLTKEMLSELLILLEQVAMKKGRHIHVSLNRTQEVLQVKFTEKVPVGELAIEKVDEEGIHTIID